MNKALLSVPEAFVDAVASLRAQFPEPAPTARLPMTVNTFGDAELAAALAALVRGPMTMGPRVAAFEAAFAAAMGTRHAVFCNSGSSANLLAIAALTRTLDAAGVPLLGAGDEVIVPAVTWSTTLWPVVQCGAVPVIVDVSSETLNLTVQAVEAALSPRTRAVFAVHLLGNPAPIVELRALCAARGLTLVEDTCEALDAEVPDPEQDGAARKAGTFGRFGTYSFYFSHHISTIEGGMVTCDDDADADRLRILRSHGWTRHMAPATRVASEQAHAAIDPRFLFVDHGYNLRGTDVQAAIGLVQLERRHGFLQRRREVAAAWHAVRAELREVFVPIHFAAGASHFAFPLILRRDFPATRAEFFAFLEAEGIETRPLVAGNLARQPALAQVQHRIAGDLAQADLIHERGMYVGIHPVLDATAAAHLPEVLRRFARQHGAGSEAA